MPSQYFDPSQRGFKVGFSLPALVALAWIGIPFIGDAYTKMMDALAGDGGSVTSGVLGFAMVLIGAVLPLIPIWKIWRFPRLGGPIDDTYRAFLGGFAGGIVYAAIFVYVYMPVVIIAGSFFWCGAAHSASCIL